MQVQNFECQIARAQIGRYLAGDVLSEDILSELEAHVGKCAECKQNLAERRAALQAMLAPAEPAGESHRPVRLDLPSFIKSKLRSRQPVEAAVEIDGPKSFTKPALYSVALGIVLIGMSYASKNMTSMLGPTADKVGVATPAPIVTAAPMQKPAPSAPPPPAKPATVVLAKPAPKPVPKPAATVVPSKSKTKPAPKRAATPIHRAPRQPRNTIRVYDPEN